MAGVPVPLGSPRGSVWLPKPGEAGPGNTEPGGAKPDAVAPGMEAPVLFWARNLPDGDASLSVALDLTELEGARRRA